MSTPETPDAAPDADETAPVTEAGAAEPGAADAAPLVELTPPAPAALPPAFDPSAASTPDARAFDPFAVPAAEPPTASAQPSPAPRVRWAGIVWGLVLAAIAAVSLWILTDAARQATVTTWLVSLTPAAAVAYAVLVVGGLALVTGIVGLARHAQRGLDRRRTPDPA